MNKTLYELLKSKIKLKITGKNINRFINKLINRRINLIKIKRIDDNTAVIIIYKEDYQKIVEVESIYEIDIIGASGIIKIRKQLKINQLLILAIFLGIIGTIYLSNIIFTVNIVYTDQKLVELLTKELANYGIKTGALKKDFNDIEKIKKEILEKYKDKIEWFEIEIVGTKYIVKLEERKLNPPEINKNFRNIVASKSAIIKDIIAINGEIIRNINTYVDKGDVVISGEILLYEEIKKTVAAEGKVYGEVWYTVTTSFPFVYNEKKETGKTQTVYGIKLFSKYLVTDFKKYKDKNTVDQYLLFNNILPFAIIKQKQIEMNKISFILTEEEALDKAIAAGRKKIEEKLKSGEYIIGAKQLKKNAKNSKIEVVMFYTVYEDITEYQLITSEE